MKLYLVPTPIGNLEDMTFRAITVLKEVDFILAEDTRTSGKLLKHYEIGTQMHSHHMHNEHKSVKGVVQRIQNGETCALISDAGTPAISDPGLTHNPRNLGHTPGGSSSGSAAAVAADAVIAVVACNVNLAVAVELVASVEET